MAYLSKGGMILDIFCTYDSPMGPLLLISDGEYLTGLYFSREAPEKIAEIPVFLLAKRWLDAYFQGENPQITVSMALQGTEFQKRVWEILLTIPYGQTRTYGSIAKQLAAQMGKEKMSAQAVGQAVGRNPVSILVPCHRVVGEKRKLTGYTGGMEKKIWLLQHEGWLPK